MVADRQANAALYRIAVVVRLRHDLRTAKDAEAPAQVVDDPTALGQVSHLAVVANSATEIHDLRAELERQKE